MPFLVGFNALSDLGFTTKISLFVGVHVLGFIILALWNRSRRPADLDLPIVGDANASDFREAMEEGARKVWKTQKTKDGLLQNADPLTCSIVP